MSKFRSTLEALIEKSGMNQLQLAEATGISSSMLGRIRSGDKPRPDPEDIIRLTGAIAPEDIQAAQLLRAHLEDEAVGPAKNLIRVQVTNPSALRETATTEEESALAVVRIHLYEPDISPIIIHLARLIQHGDPSTPITYTKLSSAKKRNKRRGNPGAPPAHPQ